MITVSKIITVAGEGPFEYLWTSSNSCASFSSASGTTTGTIQTDISFVSEACFATAVISLTITSACGNSITEEITVDNPCQNLMLSGPTVSGDFTFSASATGSTCTNVDFTWTYDTSLFSLVSSSTSNTVSTIKLKLKKSNPPASSPISVKVTDCNNCEEEQNLVYLFCSPTLPAKVVYLYSEAEDESFFSGVTMLSVSPGCSTFTPDWTTLTYALPGNFTAQNNGSGSTQYSALNTVAPGTYSGTYTVKSTLGVSAQQGNITFILSRPAAAGTIVLQNSVFTLSCDQVPGTVVDVPIDYYILGNATVDWSSFEIVNPPTPKSTSIVLGFDGNGARVIKYTVPNPIESDAFSFILCDTDGNCADAGSISIIECAPDPIATNDAFSVVCGSTTDLAVLLNDNGNGSPLVANSITITLAPTHGTLSVVNGVVTYVADAGYAGSDTFKYTVKNSKGATSNEATVTLTVLCAGSDVSVTICN